MSNEHLQDVKQGKRFQFGSNWRSFLRTLDEDRVREAVESLRQMLGVDDLSGMRFLDIGSGSGLFSLAARRLGARVHSFDFDPESVACAMELRRRYFTDDPAWSVEEGSALDEAYLASLGKFDVVYSWGVLHHTGDLAKGLSNAMRAVAEGGLLFIALYNDQEELSRFWLAVKRTYCSGPVARAVVLSSFVPWFALQSMAVGLVRHGRPLQRFVDYWKRRGMSPVHDWVDWLGGLPFEVAKPGDVVELHRRAGFELVRIKTTNRLGCNEFVFRRAAHSDAERATPTARHDLEGAR